MLVRITHCGVCHSDLSYAQGTLSIPLPVVLGHEAAGIVEEVGAGVTAPMPGEKVVLTNRPACGRCYWCVRGEAQLCAVATKMLEGVYPDGGTRLARDGQRVYRGFVVAAFAERTVVPASAAVPVPPDTPLATAAVIGCSVMTGVGAVLNTARVPAGASVMVIGLGGVGASIVQGARIAGATVIIGVDPVATRREQAQRLGATHVLDPGEAAPQRAARELTAGVGVDYAFDAVGRAEIVETLLKATRNGGTTVMVGLPRAGETVSVAALAHNIYEKKLIGCYSGSGNAWQLVRTPPTAVKTAGSNSTRWFPRCGRSKKSIEAFDDLRLGRGMRTVLTMGTQAPLRPACVAARHGDDAPRNSVVVF